MSGVVKQHFASTNPLESNALIKTLNTFLQKVVITHKFVLNSILTYRNYQKNKITAISVVVQKRKNVVRNVL